MRLLLIILIITSIFTFTYKSQNTDVPVVQNKPWIPNYVEPQFNDKDAIESITQEELKEFLYYIASAEMEGRAPGTEGYRKSAEFFEKEFKSYGMKGANNGSFKQHFVDNRGSKTWNVAGYFPGNDPLLKDEVIVIGAHLDHLGRSSRGIYYGADDNGSGSVALLEIAEAISHIKDKIKRTVLIIAFSSEERGLIGSSYYVKNPLFPLSKTVAMLNMDMIGYLKNQSNLLCLGAAKTDSLNMVLKELDDNYPFSAKTTSSAGGGSDHFYFAKRNIPVTFFHTGTSTGTYHTVRDTVDKIDYQGMTHIVRFVFEFYTKIDELKNI